MKFVINKKFHYLLSWQIYLAFILLIGLNFGLFSLINYLKLPLFLDSLGTVLITALAGPLPGITTAIITAFLCSILNSDAMYYAFVGIICSILFFISYKRGWFKKPLGALLTYLVIGLLCGLTRVVISWSINGGELENGFATIIYFNGINKFFELWLTLTLYELLDKVIIFLVTFIILHFLPKKFCDLFPYGKYCYEETRVKKINNLSITYKSALIAIFAGIITSISTASVSTVLYRNQAINGYSEQAQECTTNMMLCVDGSKIDYFLEKGDQDAEYISTKKQLNIIYKSYTNVKFVYVYKILQGEKCEVIFDLDTPWVEGNKLGDTIDFDDSFLKY